MKDILILAVCLCHLSTAQNTFQNTIFDLPAQLGGEPVGVAAQAQGAPLFVQSPDQAIRPPPLPHAPQPLAQSGAITPAPFTFPTLPTVAPFTLPSHPTIAPFTLPTHAPFTFPTHPPLVFPTPSTPSPFVPPSPYAFVPQGFQQGQQQSQNQNQFQQYNGYPQQGNQNQYYNNQYNNNGYYNQQPQQQQFQGYNTNQAQNQQQQNFQQVHQPTQPVQPQPQPHQNLPQVQTPVPVHQPSSQAFQGPQQVQSFEVNSQIVQPVRAVQANAQVVQPVLRPAANAVATAIVVDTDASAKKATEFNQNIKNTIGEPKPAHVEKASLDAEVDATIDRHLWFAADYDAKQCRQHLNGIGVRFQKKFPSYLQKGGKDRELAELVEQRLLECERKSTASHWDKVDTLLQKINLTKSEEGECRAGLIQERISCVNLLKYACQFVDSSYHFKLVPARITIQEARQAESGADKCRQVIKIVKQRLENQDGFNALVL